MNKANNLYTVISRSIASVILAIFRKGPFIIIILLLAVATKQNHMHIPPFILGIIQGSGFALLCFTIYGGLYTRAVLYLDGQIYPDSNPDKRDRQDTQHKPDLEVKRKWHTVVGIVLKLPYLYLGLPFRITLITISAMLITALSFFMILSLIDFEQFTQAKLGYAYIFSVLTILLNIIEMSINFDLYQG